MTLNGQTVGRLTVYCVDYAFIMWYHGAGWHSLTIIKTTWTILNGQTGWLAVFCVDYAFIIMISQYRMAWFSYHSNHVDDIEWSDSRRVDRSV